MKKLLLLSLLTFLPSCALAQTDVDMCKKNDLLFTIPAQAVGVNVPTVSYSIISNFSSELQSINKYGSVEISITDFSLSDELGDLTWISYVSIKMESSKDKAAYPSVLLAEQNVSNQHGKITLEIKQSSDIVEKYLSAGEVQFTYTLSGVLPASAKLTSNLCLAAKVRVDKSISDL